MKTTEFTASRGAAILLLLSALLVPAPVLGDTLEPNDTIAQAWGPLPSGDPVESFLGSPGDKDYFFLDADPGPLTISLTGIPTGLDYDLFIVDAFDNILASSDSTGDTDELIEANVFTAERFWVLVESPGGESDDFDSYVLTATYTPTVLNEPPAITVLSPNGGERWIVSTLVHITWSATDPDPGDTVTVDLDLSLDDGATWTPIAADLPNFGSTPWTVPPTPAQNAWIRAVATDRLGAASADTSDAAFEIAVNTAPTVTVLAPNGGETLPIGPQGTILYEASDLETGTALIITTELSRDGGATWTTLGGSLLNTGSAGWQVTGPATETARIRVTARDGMGAEGSDTSDGDFTLFAEATRTATVDLADGVSASSGERSAVAVNLEHERALSQVSLVIGFDPERLLIPEARTTERSAGHELTIESASPGVASVTLSASPGDSLSPGSGSIVDLLVAPRFGFAGIESVLVTGAQVLDTEGDPLDLTLLGGSLSVTQVDPELVLSVPGDLHATPGDSLDLAVLFAANVTVDSLSFALRYDRLVLTPLGASLGPRGDGFDLDANLELPGEARFVLDHPGSGALAPGSGAVCMVRFAVAGDAPGNAALSFASATAVNEDGLVLPVTTETGTVTPVESIQLHAAHVVDGVRIRWTDAADPAGILGYRVLRDRGEAALPAIAVSPVLAPATREFLDTVPESGSVRYWVERVDRSGRSTLHGPAAATLPASFALGPARPNPSRGKVRFQFSARTARPEAVVLDARGRLVCRVTPQPQGIIWDGRLPTGAPAPAGLYFLMVREGDRRQVRRLVRLAP